MSFSEWNRRLLEYFFSEERAHQRVWLAMDTALLGSSAFAELGGLEGFKAAVRKGPEWPSTYVQHPPIGEANWKDPGNLCDRALGLHRQWPLKEKYSFSHSAYTAAVDNGPPYLPYLCLLSIAWTVNNEAMELGAGAYYKRLEAIYPVHGLGSPQMEQLEVLWKDLAVWTESLERRRGVFAFETVGSDIRVGVPLSQVLIRAGDERSLHAVFEQRGWSPTYTPDKNELLAVAREVNHIDKVLTRADELQRCAIAERVADTLRRWVPREPASRPVYGRPRAGGATAVQVASAPLWLEATLRLRWSGTAWDGSLRIDGAPGMGKLELAAAGQRIEMDDNGSGELQVGVAEALKLIRNGLDGTFEFEDRIKTPARVRARNPRWLGLERWTDSVLDELPAGLPRAGCFILWAQAGQLMTRREINMDVPPEGIPPGWILSYLEADPPVDLFKEQYGPGRRPEPIPRLRWRGGSPLDDLGRLFWRFDPPELHASLGPKERLKTVNCELVERDATDPKQFRRHIYRVKVGRDDRVEVRVHDANNQVLESSYFLVGRPSSAVVTTASGFVYDACGRVAPRNDGVFGPVLHGFASALEKSGDYEQIKTPDDAPLNKRGLDELAESLPLKLLDGVQQEWTYSELRAWIQRIDEDAWNEGHVYEQVLALAGLGHLELQADMQGRWERLLPVKPCLYLRPVNVGRDTAAVLSGSYSGQALQDLVHHAQQRGLPILRRPQKSFLLVPDRVMVCAPYLKDLLDLANTCKLQFSELPPSWQLARWANGIANIKLDLDGAGHDVVQVYDSVQYRYAWTRDLPPKAGLYAVLTEDRVVRRRGGRGLQPMIVKTRDGSSPQWYRMNDRRLAAWIAHVSAPREKGRQFRVVYDQTHRSLVVPRDLALPLLWERAIMLAGGLAPIWPRMYGGYRAEEREEYIWGHAAYRWGGNHIAPGYLGPCIEYPEVPFTLAKFVAEKLGAQLVCWCRMSRRFTI